MSMATLDNRKEEQTWTYGSDTLGVHISSFYFVVHDIQSASDCDMVFPFEEFLPAE